MTLQLLDPQRRYQGLYYDPWMQALADRLAVDLAAHVRGQRRDYDNMPIELAPFYAYELRALNYTRELGEIFERSSLAFARELNRLAGTEEGWFVLCRSLGAGADLRYVQDNTRPNYLGVDAAGNAIAGAVRNTGVELDIIPPLNLAANATLLSPSGQRGPGADRALHAGPGGHQRHQPLHGDRIPLRRLQPLGGRSADGRGGDVAWPTFR